MAGMNKKKYKILQRKVRIIDLVILLVIIGGIIFFLRYNDFLFSFQDKNKSREQTNTAAMKQGKVIFYDEENRRNLEIFVELAESEYDQSKGLMFRNEFSENQGMMFIYPDEELRYFWMKNTPVALDLIFVDKTMHIRHIHKNAQPFSEKLIASVEAAMYVVEVHAGVCDRYDIKKGQRISWEIF